MATLAPKRTTAAPVEPAGLAARDDVALLPVSNPGLLAVGIMTATLLQILDTTIANVAIPHMQAALGATSDEISWVLTSYIVTSAVAIPTTGWLADRIGSRRLFLGSVFGFIVASVLCGMAANIEQMVLFRGLQGIAGAYISPLSQAAMIDTNRPSKQTQMMAIWGMGVMVGPILGPVLGGWLTENWNWRAVFYVNLPVGLLGFAILYFLLPNRPAERRPFDLFGFACVGTMLASIQLLLDRGNQLDWFDSIECWVYAGLALSAAWMGAVHFVTARHPLFDRRLFKDSSYLTANVMMFAMGMVMFASMVLLPPMLQHLFGYDVIGTGFMLMPRGIGVLFTMQVSAQLIRRQFDPRILVAAGTGLIAYSCAMMAGWSLALDQRAIVLASLVQGIGMGLVFMPLNVMAFATLAPQLRTEGASMFNLSRSMGSSVGISIVTALLARNIQTAHSEIGGHVTGAAMNVLDLSTLDRYQVVGDAALRAIDGEVNRQAAMVAYVDNFHAMMWMSLLALPLILFVRRPPRL